MQECKEEGTWVEEGEEVEAGAGVGATTEKKAKPTEGGCAVATDWGLVGG